MQKPRHNEQAEKMEEALTAHHTDILSGIKLIITSNIVKELLNSFLHV